MLIKLKVGATFCLGRRLSLWEESEYILNRLRLVWFAKYASRNLSGVLQNVGQ